MDDAVPVQERSYTRANAILASVRQKTQNHLHKDSRAMAKRSGFTRGRVLFIFWSSSKLFEYVVEDIYIRVIS